MEIHKTLDEQEPRKGLSPTEPLKPYGIQDSVEDFQRGYEKSGRENRMTNSRMSKNNRKNSR